LRIEIYRAQANPSGFDPTLIDFTFQLPRPIAATAPSSAMHAT
jgi:hypothetical protein